MREYIDYIGDKEQYSLSDYLYSESEAFYMDAPRDTCDVVFLELIIKFQEDTPYHAGIATWEKIIAFAFAKNLSVDDANDILQEYHFTALYPKSLLESSIIYALNTGMGAKAWIGLYKKYQKMMKSESQENKSAVFGKRLEKREFYFFLAESKSVADLDSRTKMVAEMRAKADVTKDVGNSIIKVLNDYYNGKLSISKVANLIKKEIDLQSKDIFYHMAKNADFNSREDVEVLYSKLKKNSSSLLTLDVVQKAVEGIEPECAYEKLKLYFDDNFSLDALYDMLKLFSKASPDNDDTFGITLDNTNQEITQ